MDSLAANAEGAIRRTMNMLERVRALGDAVLLGHLESGHAQMLELWQSHLRAGPSRATLETERVEALANIRRAEEAYGAGSLDRNEAIGLAENLECARARWRYLERARPAAANAADQPLHSILSLERRLFAGRDEAVNASRGLLVALFDPTWRANVGTSVTRQVQVLRDDAWRWMPLAEREALEAFETVPWNGPPEARPTTDDLEKLFALRRSERAAVQREAQLSRSA